MKPGPRPDGKAQKIEPNRCPNGARVLDEDPREPDYVEAVELQIGSDGAPPCRFRDAAMAAESTPQHHAWRNLRSPGFGPRAERP
jgi:hypothetical protein